MILRASTLLLALILACATPAWAQNDLQRAKDLYAAAAYEEALAVLKAMPDAERIPQVGQYRVFCLIALGQTKAADQAIEALLVSDPMYLPDPAETSPRVLEAFVAARERALPAITKQMYADAKTALERKDRDTAVTGFERLLRAIDSAPEMKGELADLRVLADGFLTLSRALPEPPAASTPDPAPSSAPTPAPAESAPIVASSTRPVAIKQEIPPWITHDDSARRVGFSGTLRVRVGVDGKVQSAEMVERVHPAYEQVLLKAAKSWLYEPATQNGVAVPGEVLIQIQLRPPGG
jgi:tetratricopeptide (TPR) repeat protein